ncbi:phosphoglycolate phosphatase [Parasedimentitalea psychrophila]|uniref:phosphoglycolate phosphatase n=1 Tax=Parasedimentitalea psychrophila TaxID=2997337 RepID=A0A9Y2P7Q6_9RHOB|nr:phosphoglycolate phosphatase [Parasedimentitalea psychrophila]WIY26070.1 phosphoglycolate phosphatase [Parasedimentitalea psychrophila]
MARIVFDLDGTLIDSAPDIHGIANKVLEQERCEGISLAQTHDFIGNGAAVFVSKMRAARGIGDSEQARLYTDFVARYDDAVTLTLPYSGVLAALDKLKASGHRLGICTNKPISPCRAVLAHLKMDHYFDTMWGGDSLAVHKPDPAPLHAAFAALGDGPQLYVGDSDVDAETGQRAGVPFLLYTEGYRKFPVEQMPHTVAFSDFAELPRLVHELLVAA